MDNEAIEEYEIPGSDNPVTDIPVTEEPVPEKPETDIRTARNTFTRVGFSFFMLALASITMQFAVSQFVNWAFPSFVPSSLANYALILLPMYLIAVPICVFFLKKLEPSQLEQKSISFGAVLGFLLMCLPIMYAGNFFGAWVTRIIAENAGNAGNGGGSSSESITSLILGSDILSNLIFVGLIAPVIEEFLFRKLLIDRIVKYGEGIAIFTSALMFGLFHGNFTQFFYAFGLGLMFSYVYCRTGKIRYSIILHMIVNTLGSVVAPFVLSKVDLNALDQLSKMAADDPKFTDTVTEILPGLMLLLLYAGVLLIMAIVGLVLLIVRRRRFVLDNPELPIPYGKKVSTVWLNIGMVLFVLITAGMFFLSHY